MKRIIHHQKNRLMDLLRISLQGLTQFKGMGLVKAIKIKAVLELLIRLQTLPNEEKKQFNSNGSVFKYLTPFLSALPH